MTVTVRRGVRVGVDVGSVRVGVAVSDPDGILATPAVTLARRADGRDLDELVALVAEREAIEVIVGLPRSMSGAEGAAAAACRAYAVALAARIAPTPVRLSDERLTTVSAHRALARVPGRGRRAVVDQAAAVEILQAALENERSSGKLGQLVEVAE